MKMRFKMPKSFGKVSAEKAQQGMRMIGVYAQNRLTQLAQQNLHSTASAYLRGLQYPKSMVVTSKSVTINLIGDVPNMIEKGAKSFDIKKMLKGRKYVDVPFRHGTPGTTVLKPMPKATYNSMKSLVAKAKNALGTIRGPNVMPGGPNFGGMVRVAKAAGQSKQSQFYTFRRISANSPKSSWIHPGMKAVNFFDTVWKEVQKVGPKILQAVLSKGLR